MAALRSLLPIVMLLLAACALRQRHDASGGAAASAEPCALSPSDRSWLDRAMHAWDYTGREITGIGRVREMEAIIFEAECVLTSGTAMTEGPQVWRAWPHGGEVPLPHGGTIPADVTSFAMDDEERAFFVMSTPSVWRAAGKEGNGLDLETLMVAVLLHEGTQVAQIPTYGAQMTKIAERWNLPESFNDDSIQKRFQGDSGFAASVRREIDLLLTAATTKEAAASRRLAREARAPMRARQERWYPPADGYLRPVEDLYLTLEGSAQWAAYQWVVDPNGGNVSPAVAFPLFGRRGKWWSQEEGFALFMAPRSVHRGRMEAAGVRRWRQDGA
jgi:hypothetical protein